LVDKRYVGGRKRVSLRHASRALLFGEWGSHSAVSLPSNRQKGILAHAFAEIIIDARFEWRSIFRAPALLRRVPRRRAIKAKRNPGRVAQVIVPKGPAAVANASPGSK
jgi:hypothetical protein